MDRALDEFRFARYRARDVSFEIRVAAEAGVLVTREGPVRCMAGDVIITGVQGESWPVSPEVFARHYQPCDRLPSGSGHRYRKWPLDIEARRLSVAHTLALEDGRGILQGAAGDWLVRVHGDPLGRPWIVAASLFAEYYEPDGIPFLVALDRAATRSPSDVAAVCAGLSALRAALPNSPLVLLEGEASDHMPDQGRLAPFSFQLLAVGDDPAPGGQSPGRRDLREPLRVPLGRISGASAAPSMLALLERRRTLEDASAWRGALRYTLASVLPGLAQGGTDPESSGHDDDVAIVAQQLASLEYLNLQLRLDRDGDQHDDREVGAPATRNADAQARFISACPPALLRAGMPYYRAVGATADRLAGACQGSWQRLLLASTADIAAAGARDPTTPGERPRSALRRAGEGLRAGLRTCRLLLSTSLASLTLLAALSLVSFLELSEPCARLGWWSAHSCADADWHVWFGPVALFLGYVGTLLFAWGRFASAKARRVEQKHQDLRLLAECLRLHYVTCVLGEARLPDDDLPLAYPDESGWVRHALIALDLILPIQVSPPGQTGRAQPGEEAQAWVAQAFLDHQLDYHRHTLLKRREQALAVLQGLVRIGRLGFFAALLLLCLQVAGKLIDGEASGPPSLTYHLMVIAQVLSIALWGTMQHVAETLGLEQERRRGELMMAHLEYARQVYDDPRSTARMRSEELLKVGHQFVDDQAAWHALHRSRPVEAARSG